MKSLRLLAPRRSLPWIARLPRVSLTPSHLDAAAHGAAPLVRATATGFATAEFSHACLIRLIDYPDLPFRAGDATVIKDGDGVLLVRTEFPVGRQLKLAAYKRTSQRKFWKVIAGWFRQDKLHQSWNLATRFLAAGIATAEPLAVVIPRRFTFARDSYAAYAWIEEGRTLDAFLAACRNSRPEVAARLIASAAKSLGDLLGRMHGAGFSHRDLKTSNLLIRINRPETADAVSGEIPSLQAFQREWQHSVKRCGATALEAGNGPRGQDEFAIETFVIDLDGAKQWHCVPLRRRLRDLARLAICFPQESDLSRSIRARFLRAYLDAYDKSVRQWGETKGGAASASPSARANRANFQKLLAQAAVTLRRRKGR